MTLEGLARMVMKLLEKDDMTRRRVAFHNFPYRKICGIEVFVSFEFTNFDDLVVNFNIEASNTRFSCDEYYIYSKTLDTVKGEDIPFSSITLEKIVGYFEKVVEIIPTLKLDKYDVCLSDEPNVFTEECLSFFKFENTELKYDACSVCLETCGSMTSDCKHHLCLECCEKIAETDHDCGPEGICDECGTKKCPICRTDFMSLQKA